METSAGQVGFGFVGMLRAEERRAGRKRKKKRERERERLGQ